jgi:hypothetical protein
VRKRVKEGWQKFLDGTAIYLLAVAGVFMAPYISLMGDGKKFTIELDWNVMAVSLFIALLLLWDDERGGDLDGKRKNFKRRAKAALYAGAFWYSILGG